MNSYNTFLPDPEELAAMAVKGSYENFSYYDDGNTIVQENRDMRRYLVDQELYIEVMDEMLGNEDYRRKYYPIMTWDENITNSIVSAWCTLPQEVLDGFKETSDASKKTVESADGNLGTDLEMNADDCYVMQNSLVSGDFMFKYFTFPFV